MTSAGVNNITKFVQSSNKVFASYVSYIDRETAIRNEHFTQFNAINYENYQHYMDNPEKTGGLFGATLECFNPEQLREVKTLFKQAQHNESIMWQDVISFDNEWLTKHGAYSPSTGELDESIIRKGVREGMAKMLAREGIQHSALWTASIHYNTDNIHVHIATVEPEPTRPIETYRDKKTNRPYQARRGKRKLSSLDMMKQLVASNILNREDSLTKLTSLIRQDLTLVNQGISQTTDRELKQQFMAIYRQLPSDKRLWKVNNQALTPVRPLINSFVQTYIEKYQHESMTAVDRMIDDEITTIKETYGVGSKQADRSEDFRQTKYNEIYTRMGNQLLREINAFDKERYTSTQHMTPKTSAHSLDKTLHALRKLLDPKKNYHNQQIYQQLKQTHQNEQGYHL